MLENERNAAKTGMNDASSRSHAIVELKMYRKEGANFHLNTFRFLDLAGSERFGKKDKGKWDQVSHHGNCPMELIQAMGTNFSLSTFTRVLGNVTNLKKPITGGEKLPDGVGWKEINITRVLKSSFSGYAFSGFILCLS